MLRQMALIPEIRHLISSTLDEEFGESAGQLVRDSQEFRPHERQESF